MKKKVLALFLIIMMLSALMPQAALAADHAVADGETLNIETGVLTHADSTTETLTISDGDTISVAAGAAATITGSKNVMIDCGAGAALTLDDVTSDVSATEDACALAFTGSGNTLTLAGTSTLKSGEDEPGVRVKAGTALEIEGAGSLEATGGRYGAGIGGDYSEGIGGGYTGDGGDITIVSGTVTATGGDYSAGIGGGRSGDGGDITIVSGNVTATGGDHGAGIGGGHSGDGVDITIVSGTVTATGGGGGTGIGGGYAGDGGSISILGGNISATGGGLAAGIGGGGNCSGGAITISGNAYVTATGGRSGAGIGSGDQGGGGGTITIEGTADVTATGGSEAAGIGGGNYSSGGRITISGGTVYANGQKRNNWAGAGIGGGSFRDGGVINITGGTVTAGGDGGSAGIGGGDNGAGGRINISGGTVIAEGGDSGAGIGGGCESAGGTITIEGTADVTATGGVDSAGIGGGSSGGTINISGGIVYAMKDAGGTYDIGPGTVGSAGTISISGTAAVFLGTNSFHPSPVTTHTHYSFTEDTDEAYGIPVPAEWEPTFGAYLPLYNLDYDANGGSGTVPASVTEKFVGEKVTVGSGDSLTREHYIFGGWNTAADGSGTDYAPGDEFTFTENTTLYAQWTMLCDLNYDANGGSGTVPVSVTDQLAGEKVTVGSGDGLTREHYKFSGWNTAADGSGTAYAPGDEFTFTEDTTLYAQWTTQYVLQYNANGGSGTPPPSETEWSDSGVTATVVRNAKGLRYAGHTFDGWNTAANGSGTAYDPGDDFTYTGVTTLYAQWKTPVKSVSLDSTSKTLVLNETIDLDATVSPKSAANAGLIWKSSDDSIVTVDGTGIITAKGFGSATVTAEADGKFDTCTVTVVKTDVAGVRLSSTSKTMGIGDTATLRATVTPGDATHPDVAWKSTDASVVTVSQSGKVTAVAEGAAAITAEADGQFAVCAVLVSSESDDGTEPSPTLTAAASPRATGETEGTPDTGDAPAPTEQTAETFIITIVVSDLPDGTVAIELPNGKVVELDGFGTMRIEVDASDIGGDGSVELIALDEEGIPLGTSTVTAADRQAVDADTGRGIWKVLLWVFIGLAGIGGAAAGVYLLWRKGQRV